MRDNQEGQLQATAEDHRPPGQAGTCPPGARCETRAPSRPRWFGWLATCVPGPSQRPTRSSPPPAASASCRTASVVSETSFSLLAWEARTAQQMWGDGEAEAEYGYHGELLLIRQKGLSWRQVRRVRANARVQAGTSEAAGALT